MKYTWETASNPITINSFTANKTSPQTQGTSVKFTVNAEGGDGTLQYRFYRVINGTTKIFRDYTTSNSAYCNPPIGDYTIYVDVKDENGNIKAATLILINKILFGYKWGYCPRGFLIDFNDYNLLETFT